MDTGWYIVKRVKGQRLTEGPYEPEEILNDALVGKVKPTTTLFHPEITQCKKIYAMQLPSLQDIFASRQRAYKVDHDYIQSGVNTLAFMVITAIIFLLLTM